MATFRPTKNVCELDFDGKYFYTVPLNDSTLRRFVEICNGQMAELEKLDKNDEASLDKAYNLSLDALDEMLGEGAGADVMSLFENPGMVEVGQVITFIADEYTKQYKAAFPNSNKPAPNTGKRGRR